MVLTLNRDDLFVNIVLIINTVAIIDQLGAIGEDLTGEH